MRVFHSRLQRLQKADLAVARAIRAARAFFCAVHVSEFQGVNAEFLGQFIHHTLAGKSDIGATGSAIGLRFGLVHQHVVAIDQHVV